ncbi:protein-L-isoaspartate O-methyltransferase family protein [Ketogulonicigenium robustum]|nr:protein-L-isoaspartate O-methyltransferase [Ketogulonicigenium robustum]
MPVMMSSSLAPHAAQNDLAQLRITMVDRQVRPSDVTAYPVIAAMLDLPREEFVPAALREVAYSGADLAIAPGRAMPEPRTLAKMVDALAVSQDDRVLVVGAGLGYGAALIARLAQSVVALEELPHLAAAAQQALADHAPNARVLQGKLAEGAPENAPFDVILVEGGVNAVPVALSAQLAEGGRICAVFVQGGLGQVRVGTQQGGQIYWRLAFTAMLPVLPGFATSSEFAL